MRVEKIWYSKTFHSREFSLSAVWHLERSWGWTGARSAGCFSIHSALGTLDIVYILAQSEVMDPMWCVTRLGTALLDFGLFGWSVFSPTHKLGHVGINSLTRNSVVGEKIHDEGRRWRNPSTKGDDGGTPRRRARMEEPSTKGEDGGTPRRRVRTEEPLNEGV